MSELQPPRFPLFKNIWTVIRKGFGWLRGQLALPKGLERWLTVGMALAALLAFLYKGWEASTGLGQAVDLVISAALGIIVFFLSLVLGVILIRLIRWLVDKAPTLVLVTIIAALSVQIWLWKSSYWINIWLAAGVVLSIFLFSLGLYLVSRQWQTSAGLAKKILALGALLVGLAGFGGYAWLFGNPGEPALELPGVFQPGAYSLNLPDPSSPGPFQVAHLTYDSGQDKRRPEYGADADLLTDSVDASPYVGLSGWRERAGEWYWGFDMDEVPLNAQVWYPLGEGPFPLVLVVHGNHAMVEDSEMGYAYLGELLASRGFIVASVDENFFNGGFFGGVRGENDARAWLLLKHLEVWKRWNSQPGSVFYHKVNLDHIALVGHSRGGEAVALAAEFNQLSHYPENGFIRWDFHFNIQAVVAIAPVDQQYEPAGHQVALQDVNYLVLQGSHDGDVSSFKGIQQYERVTFSDPAGDAFKAAVYIYRADHSQFNTTWGNRDREGIQGALLDTSAYLSGDEQRQIAKVYISAFLETTLHGQDQYLPFFEDYRAAGDWLPATNYISQYQDGGTLLAADFEEDADLTTASLPGGHTYAGRVNSWKERALRFRNGDIKQNHVVRLSWNGTHGYFAVSLPDGAVKTWTLDSADLLVFLVADGRDPFEVNAPLDFSVRLLDKAGNSASVALSEVITLSPQMPVRFTKIDTWENGIFENSAEDVFQSVRIPLALFLANNPELSLESLSEIRFIFDQTTDGTVSLDEIGFDLEH